MKPRICSCLLLVLAGLVFGETKIAVSGSVEWERMEINATVTMDLASAGIRLPTGRIQAEEILRGEYPYLIRPYLLSIPVDSANTLGDLLNQGVFSLKSMDSISSSAQKVPPVLTFDLAFMSARYTLSLNNLSGELIRHNQPADSMRILIPVPAIPYTGILIIADEALPVHGKHVTALTRPCLFPKVWDTDMNLIYEQSMVDPQQVQSIVRYVSPNQIFRSTPSGLEDELIRLVGSNPLRIIAQGVFGIHLTDPIIDRQDALQIVSLEDNRKLLREGRIAIVLNQQVLRIPFSAP
ncbi:MAG: polymerase [Treponema sp.]|nr:polymerase [Treponema sp.]